MNMFNFPYHMVTLSPWPLLSAMNLFNFLIVMIFWFYNLEKEIYILLFLNFFILLSSVFQWWRDIIRESTYQGFHTNVVLMFMKFGMILFIISEVFFFISFFWMYFHSSISPNVEIGMFWPPKMIIVFNPYDIPMLNSIILVSSGMVVTWSHQSLLNNNFIDSKNSLILTILLGLYFTFLQFIEYKSSFFCMNDCIYGSSFFLITGFHGLHVQLGIMFLLVNLLRMLNNHYSNIHHFNFEASIWYWHFVDVIWLFVYLFIYWWMY